VTRRLPEDSARIAYAPLFPDSSFDLVVFAASAGGVQAMKTVIDALPAYFPASIAVVHHMHAERASLIAEVLGFRARLPVRFAQDGERLRASTVRVAPRGHHLVVSARGAFALEASEKVNYVRPAADRLFGSAARAFGPRVIAVVMSGLGRDGCAGAIAVKEAGGVVIAQDPASAVASGMPRAVVEAGVADLVLDPAGVARALVSLVTVSSMRQWLGLPRALPAAAHGSAPARPFPTLEDAWSTRDFR
jgi:two-component system chemotaxis response regulator CheB